jgi:hypothetical protein
MTELAQTTIPTPRSKNKGGRPCIPPAPQNATQCRALIATEVVKTKPRQRTLTCLYRLLKAFERAEDSAAADLKNQLQAEANRLKQEELAEMRREYQRRFDLGPLGVRVMRQRIAELEGKVAELEAKKPCMSVNSGVLPTLSA